ncbi:MAG: hypothetical protein OXG47_01130 [bacterium]|nr:hypothetical protein [bacterium]
MPTLVTIIILAALWLAVLAPRWLRRFSRYQGERMFNVRATTSAVPSWQGSSTVVALTGVKQISPMPRPALVAPGLAVDSDGIARRQRERARLRRRNVLIALAGSALITLVMAVSAGGAMIAAHLVIDGLLVAYVSALARRQRRVLERHAKVTDIASARAAAARKPEAAYQREEAGVAFMGAARGRH